MHEYLKHINNFSNAVKGKIVQQARQNTLINGISTNSKSIEHDEIFIPLKGKNFDAHNFIAEALKNGLGTIYSSDKTQLTDKKIFIKVDDTLKSLQNLGKENRLLNKNLKVIGITGSNGKTTTKEITGAILRSLNNNVFVSEKNLNNHIGVPLNLVKLTENEKYAVFEMGASAIGEIDLLASLVIPDISIITNIAPAHLEGFKTLENILKAKTEIFKHTKSFKIVNYDNPYLRRYADENKDILKFGFENGSDLRIIELITREKHKVKFSYKDQKYEFTSSLPGVHNIYNLVAAMLSVELSGFEMKQIVNIVEDLKVEISGRLKKTEYKGNLIYDDSYNANPLSVRAGIEFFYKDSKDKKKILILGEMLELGEYSKFYHEDIGNFLNKYEFEEIFLIGNETRHILSKLDFGKKAKWYFKTEDFKDDFKIMLDKGKNAYYIKGSRGNGLNKLLEVIRNDSE